MEAALTLESARLKFCDIFKVNPSLCAIAPGRVNLIGEHTDYNDGFVLPMALPMSTVILGAENTTKKCRMITLSQQADDPKDIEFDIPTVNHSLVAGKPAWANYIKGVIANFPGEISGFNAVVATSIPVGGGLSSSAALEVATYKFLEALTGRSDASWQEKAKVCQKAEHEFAGMPCGIMDQFISLMGKEDCAMLLDCRSLEYTTVPIKDPNISILITNTNVRHTLTGSEYPTRRQQCLEAAVIMGKSSLRDVTLDHLNRYKEFLKEEVFRRARHVVTEIARTTQSVIALQKQDYVQFGVLMNDSHKSLKEDFEVSCPELDLVTNAAFKCKGVYGSRMTGGGFGGCTVTLLDSSAVSHVIETIKTFYSGKPSFYICRPSAGADIVRLD